LAGEDSEVKLAQIAFPGGAIHGAIVRDDVVVDIGQPIAECLALASASGCRVEQYLASAAVSGPTYSYQTLLAEASADRPRLAMPICPPEVWGCGVTYKKSAEFRDDDTQTSKGIYDYVYSAPRPETFFKGRAAHCVGPNEPIGIRSDSTFTAPEPELALVLTAKGEIVGFTVANDVSAWDIERENPLYLPQSKIFRACCALGPVIVTPDEIGDANDLLLRCQIIRDGEVTFAGEVNTSRIGRTFAELIGYLTLDNPIPDGTVVCTGTGVIAPAENALAAGDVVSIEIEKIGLLSNPVVKLAGR
jgi:2-dehydro-3-deoxy-D-arabinonate dehydratase